MAAEFSLQRKRVEIAHRDQGRQEHQTWALVSAAAASASVLVAIAAVIVAATH